MTDNVSFKQLVAWLHEFGTLVNQNKSYLTELDGAEFPDGTPLDAARSHRWTWASACDDRFPG